VSAINNGGPAFPCPVEFDPNNQLVSHGSFGMTLRDWFAGQALSQIGNEYVGRGLVNRQAQEHALILAAHAYNIADAMLKAREVKPEAATNELTKESDNDTQCELAAWELLKEAREERDKAQALARELLAEMQRLSQWEFPIYGGDSGIIAEIDSVISEFVSKEVMP
jgi:hypothetical protein